MLIYLITNLCNGKYYIGKTQNSSLTPRFKQHTDSARQGANKYLYTAMRKYGVENFVAEVITDNVTVKASLNNFERLWITLLDAENSEIGYNKSQGGEGGGSWTEERKKAWSISRSNYVKSPEHRAAIGRAHKGKAYSAETRRKMSLSKKGKPNPKIAGANNPGFGKLPANIDQLREFHKKIVRDEKGRIVGFAA